MSNWYIKNQTTSKWHEFTTFLQTYIQTNYSCPVKFTRNQQSIQLIVHKNIMGHWDTILEHHWGTRDHRSFPLELSAYVPSIRKIFSNSEYSLLRIKIHSSNKASLVHSLKPNSFPLKIDRDPKENVILQPLIFTGCRFQGEYYPNNPYMAYVPTFTIKIHKNQPSVGKYTNPMDGMGYQYQLHKPSPVTDSPNDLHRFVHFRESTARPPGASMVYSTKLWR